MTHPATSQLVLLQIQTDVFREEHVIISLLTSVLAQIARDKNETIGDLLPHFGHAGKRFLWSLETLAHLVVQPDAERRRSLRSEIDVIPVLKLLIEHIERRKAAVLPAGVTREVRRVRCTRTWTCPSRRIEVHCIRDRCRVEGRIDDITEVVVLHPNLETDTWYLESNCRGDLNLYWLHRSCLFGHEGTIYRRRQYRWPREEVTLR